MKAAILAAGEGVRMHPLTSTRPKPMIEVLGRPILHHIFEALPDEIDEVILVTGYLEEQIHGYFGGSFGGVKINYLPQTKKIGTGAALHLCRDFLGKESFLMLYADDLQSKKDLASLIKHPLSMLVKESAQPERFGVVEVDRNDFVINVEEKPERPKTNLVSTGAKVLDERIFNYPLRAHPNGEYYITYPLAEMIKDFKIKAVRADFWLPIGYPEDIKKAEDFLNKKTAVR